ncbi:hypothetical protein D9756_010740 [Leucocoprinus leucothites]|uniref:C2H2-type domain-containing protein n=1 Tax=Leucocoprinus leucothites TaxID=201217 RepID=A0A8H5CV16_9AGAR|nr:hypothetical protein D9756_010740 [Leucoagaricus leucothites]
MSFGSGINMAAAASSLCLAVCCAPTWMQYRTSAKLKHELEDLLLEHDLADDDEDQQTLPQIVDAELASALCIPDAGRKTTLIESTALHIPQRRSSRTSHLPERLRTDSLNLGGALLNDHAQALTGGVVAFIGDEDWEKGVYVDGTRVRCLWLRSQGQICANIAQFTRSNFTHDYITSRSTIMETNDWRNLESTPASTYPWKSQILFSYKRLVHAESEFDPVYWPGIQKLFQAIDAWEGSKLKSDAEIIFREYLGLPVSGNPRRSPEQKANALKLLFVYRIADTFSIAFAKSPVYRPSTKLVVPENMGSLLETGFKQSIPYMFTGYFIDWDSLLKSAHNVMKHSPNPSTRQSSSLGTNAQNIFGYIVTIFEATHRSTILAHFASVACFVSYIAQTGSLLVPDKAKAIRDGLQLLETDVDLSRLAPDFNILAPTYVAFTISPLLLFTPDNLNVKTIHTTNITRAWFLMEFGKSQALQLEKHAWGIIYDMAFNNIGFDAAFERFWRHEPLIGKLGNTLLITLKFGNVYPPTSTQTVEQHPPAQAEEEEEDENEEVEIEERHQRQREEEEGELENVEEGGRDQGETEEEDNREETEEEDDREETEEEEDDREEMEEEDDREEMEEEDDREEMEEEDDREETEEEDEQEETEEEERERERRQAEHAEEGNTQDQHQSGIDNAPPNSPSPISLCTEPIEEDRDGRQQQQQRDDKNSTFEDRQEAAVDQSNATAVIRSQRRPRSSTQGSRVEPAKKRRTEKQSPATITVQPATRKQLPKRKQQSSKQGKKDRRKGFEQEERVNPHVPASFIFVSELFQAVYSGTSRCKKSLVMTWKLRQSSTGSPNVMYEELFLSSSIVLTRPLNKTQTQADWYDVLATELKKHPEAVLKSNVLRTMTWKDFRKTPAQTLLKYYSEKNLLVYDPDNERGVPVRHFDSLLMEQIFPGSEWKTLEVHDYSVAEEEMAKTYEGRMVHITVQDLLDAANIPEHKRILNALDIPNVDNFDNGLERNPLATCDLAWRATQNKRPPRLSWNLAATEGAYSDWHSDSDGLGTRIEVVCGRKIWVIGEFKHTDISNINAFSRLGVEEIGKEVFNLTPIFLRPGMTLYMKPCTPHLVVTPDNTVCIGDQFYAGSTLRETCYGIFHGFAAGRHITNVSHAETSHDLLRGIMKLISLVNPHRVMFLGSSVFSPAYGQPLPKLSEDMLHRLMHGRDLSHRVATQILENLETAQIDGTNVENLWVDIYYTLVSYQVVALHNYLKTEELDSEAPGTTAAAFYANVTTLASENADFRAALKNVELQNETASIDAFGWQGGKLIMELVDDAKFSSGIPACHTPNPFESDIHLQRMPHENRKRVHCRSDNNNSKSRGVYVATRETIVEPPMVLVHVIGDVSGFRSHQSWPSAVTATHKSQRHSLLITHHHDGHRSRLPSTTIEEPLPMVMVLSSPSQQVIHGRGWLLASDNPSRATKTTPPMFIWLPSSPGHATTHPGNSSPAVEPSDGPPRLFPCPPPTYGNIASLRAQLNITTHHPQKMNRAQATKIIHSTLRKERECTRRLFFTRQAHHLPAHIPLTDYLGQFSRRICTDERNLNCTEMAHSCSLCGQNFDNTDSLKSHIKAKHGAAVFGLHERVIAWSYPTYDEEKKKEFFAQWLKDAGEGAPWKKTLGSLKMSWFLPHTEEPSTAPGVTCFFRPKVEDSAMKFASIQHEISQLRTNARAGRAAGDQEVEQSEEAVEAVAVEEVVEVMAIEKVVKVVKAMIVGERVVEGTGVEQVMKANATEIKLGGVVSEHNLIAVEAGKDGEVGGMQTILDQVMNQARDNNAAEETYGEPASKALTSNQPVVSQYMNMKLPNRKMTAEVVITSRERNEEVGEVVSPQTKAKPAGKRRPRKTIKAGDNSKTGPLCEECGFLKGAGGNEKEHRLAFHTVIKVNEDSGGKTNILGWAYRDGRGPNNTLGGSIECPFCDFITDSATNLGKHIRQASPLSYREDIGNHCHGLVKHYASSGKTSPEGKEIKITIKRVQIDNNTLDAINFRGNQCEAIKHQQEDFEMLDLDTPEPQRAPQFHAQPEQLTDLPVAPPFESSEPLESTRPLVPLPAMLSPSPPKGPDSSLPIESIFAQLVDQPPTTTLPTQKNGNTLLQRTRVTQPTTRSKSFDKKKRNTGLAPPPHVKSLMSKGFRTVEVKKSSETYIFDDHDQHPLVVPPLESKNKRQRFDKLINDLEGIGMIAHTPTWLAHGKGTQNSNPTIVITCLSCPAWGIIDHSRVLRHLADAHGQIRGSLSEELKNQITETLTLFNRHFITPEYAKNNLEYSTSPAVPIPGLHVFKGFECPHQGCAVMSPSKEALRKHITKEQHHNIRQTPTRSKQRAREARQRNQDPDEPNEIELENSNRLPFRERWIQSLSGASNWTKYFIVDPDAAPGGNENPFNSLLQQWEEFCDEANEVYLASSNENDVDPLQRFLRWSEHLGTFLAKTGDDGDKHIPQKQRGGGNNDWRPSVERFDIDDTDNDLESEADPQEGFAFSGSDDEAADWDRYRRTTFEADDDDYDDDSSELDESEAEEEPEAPGKFRYLSEGETPVPEFKLNWSKNAPLLKSFIDIPHIDEEDTKFSGRVLQEVVSEYLLKIKRDYEATAPVEVKKLLVYGNAGSFKVWNPVKVDTLRRKYFYPLHRLTIGVFNTLDGFHPLGYSFPLTKSQKSKANDLRAILRDLAEIETDNLKDHIKEHELDIFHSFIKEFLYPWQFEEGRKYNRWDDPLECFMALQSLRHDGVFRAANQTTGLFAQLKYHIRGTVYYESRRRERTERGRDFVEIVREEATNLLRNGLPGSRFSRICDYQAVTSSLAESPNQAPTTRVENNGMTIVVREVALNIDPWRQALAGLMEEVKNDLQDIFKGHEISLQLPDHIADDWARGTRGYSWAKDALEHLTVEMDGHQNPTLNPHNLLLKLHFSDPSSGIFYRSNGVFKIDPNVVHEILCKCGEIAQKIALLAFFLPGPPCRVSEFAEFRCSNNARGRNVFRGGRNLWLVVRRTKTETQSGRESFLPRACPPSLTAVMEKYILLLKPFMGFLDAVLVSNNKDLIREKMLVHNEFLWVTNGRPATAEEMRSNIFKFFEERRLSDSRLGTAIYRQMAVEMIRTFIGTEDEIERERNDVVHIQMGHAAKIARNYYAPEELALPHMSSDLLQRYFRSSEEWWKMTGVHPSEPALIPLTQRLGQRWSIGAGPCSNCSMTEHPTQQWSPMAQHRQPLKDDTATSRSPSPQPEGLENRTSSDHHRSRQKRKSQSHKKPRKVRLASGLKGRPSVGQRKKCVSQGAILGRNDSEPAPENPTETHATELQLMTGYTQRDYSCWIDTTLQLLRVAFHADRVWTSELKELDSTLRNKTSPLAEIFRHLLHAESATQGYQLDEGRNKLREALCRSTSILQPEELTGPGCLFEFFNDALEEEIGSNSTLAQYFRPTSVTFKKCSGSQNNSVQHFVMNSQVKTSRLLEYFPHHGARDLPTYLSERFLPRLGTEGSISANNPMCSKDCDGLRTSHEVVVSIPVVLIVPIHQDGSLAPDELHVPREINMQLEDEENATYNLIGLGLNSTFKDCGPGKSRHFTAEYWVNGVRIRYDDLGVTMAGKTGPLAEILNDSDRRRSYPHYTVYRLQGGKESQEKFRRRRWQALEKKYGVRLSMREALAPQVDCLLEGFKLCHEQGDDKEFVRTPCLEGLNVEMDREPQASSDGMTGRQVKRKTRNSVDSIEPSSPGKDQPGKRPRRFLSTSCHPIIAVLRHMRRPESSGSNQAIFTCWRHNTAAGRDVGSLHPHTFWNASNYSTTWQQSAMGACISKVDQQSRLRTEEIDHFFDEDNKFLKCECKILLLGPEESGKSTIAKQMKIIYQGGFTTDQLLEYRPIIYRNVLQCAHSVVMLMHNVDTECLELTNGLLMERVCSYNLETNHGYSAPFTPEMAEAIHQFLNEPAVQKAIEASMGKIYLMDSAEYFFNNVLRIGAPGYVPTETDVLHARQKSMGITETRFNMGQLSIRMFDVGGQRSERKKWIHCFESVTSIIFCTALSEYDQDLPEHKPQVPLANFFDEYTGGTDVNKAAKYILWKFMQANRAQLTVYPQ